MKYYHSQAYNSIYNSGVPNSYNTFLLLSDDERHRLADRIEQLEDDVNEKLKSGYFTIAKTKKGKLRNTTKSIYEICAKDIEAIEFLKKLTFFTVFTESLMLDPTSYQIKTIVEKLLFKVYRKTFVDWMELYISHEEVTADDMRSNMDRKRKLFKSFQKEGFIPADAKIGY